MSQPAHFLQRVAMAAVVVWQIAGIALLTAAGREVYYQGPLAPLNITPTFDHGYLIVYAEKGAIAVYGPDGMPRFTASAQALDGAQAVIKNAAAAQDGSIVAAVRTPPARGGLAFFDAAGKPVRFVDTGAYLPTQVAFAGDGALWTVGFQSTHGGQEHPEYCVLHRYTAEGRETGAFLPRSSFDPDIEPAAPVLGMWGLRAAKDRIGTTIYRAGSRQATWMEADLKGNLLGTWQFRGDRWWGAFTADGALYTKESGQVGRLDRATGSWIAVPGMPTGTLLGADGAALVFWDKDGNTLRWVTPGV